MVDCSEPDRPAVASTSRTARCAASPTRGEVVEEALPVEVLEASDRARIVRGSEIPPVDELGEMVVEGLVRGDLGEESRGAQTIEYVVRAELDDVALPRIEKDLHDRAVDRGVVCGDVLEGRDLVESADHSGHGRRRRRNRSAGRKPESAGRVECHADPIVWRVSAE